MKKCKRCLLVKSFEDYTFANKIKKIYQPYCRKCRTIIAREYTRSNQEKTSANQKKWRRKNKEKVRTIYNNQRIKFAYKIKARVLVRESVKRGIIKKLPCQVCGELKVEGHHTDYYKPLDVMWLCRKHHIEIHKK